MAARSSTAGSPAATRCSALTAQVADIMPDGSDADIVKIIVHEIGGVPLGVCQRMAFRSFLGARSVSTGSLSI